MNDAQDMLITNPDPLNQSLYLSQRERDFAEFLLQGKSDWEIAEAMGIQPRTVKHFARRLYAIFGLAQSIFHKRVRLVLLLHRSRSVCGVRCQACGEV